MYVYVCTEASDGVGTVVPLCHTHSLIPLVWVSLERHLQTVEHDTHHIYTTIFVIVNYCNSHDTPILCENNSAHARTHARTIKDHSKFSDV